MAPPTDGRTLRERKRERTRRALIDAATDLFERGGYDGTTVAEIAAHAEIGTRTFFGYFAGKEDLLFPDAAARVAAAVDTIASRRPDDGPAELLLRALSEVAGTETGMVDRMTALRMRLIQTVPAVRGRALQLLLDAQREIARHLHAAFPDRLDAVDAFALVGAFVGAVVGAVQAVLDDPPAATVDQRVLTDRVREATARALGPWLNHRA